MLFAYLCLSAATCFLVAVLGAWLYFVRTKAERQPFENDNGYFEQE